MMTFPLKTLLTVALIASAPGVARADELLVFAASSLKEALDEAAAAWATQSGDRVTVSLAGSATLARQIQAGAPADLFLSANEAWMDVLERDGLLKPGSQRNLLTNALVVVSSDPEADETAFFNEDRWSAGSGGGEIAMALVEAVPAGIYGKAALESLDWWDRMAPHVAQADNVRAALALVATGESDFGIVYATDALAESKVHRVLTFPAESHPPIRYPMAIPIDSVAPQADAFAEFLAGPEAAEIFRDHGFGLAGQGDE
ncbi:molybdate ABC transporter substrate-binding protein [Tropicimonas sp. TH_r6]|uniref:molybdate ABC transporter substrate-binding protein n=1 Tax=Tropicimonas sp. TH_r6 TaxID=3082085 RepID=UPI00295307DD|nr:molybdate ABC transporter substrate-binding protein [Tropicimonas sp. TH_r6]MDV7143787.1 molybdate ABC transporter substrate-binding protein [Tropicimonas sp. TH_r6]